MGHYMVYSLDMHGNGNTVYAMREIIVTTCLFGGCGVRERLAGLTCIIPGSCAVRRDIDQ